MFFYLRGRWVMASSGVPSSPSVVKVKPQLSIVPVLMIWGCSFLVLGVISKVLAFEDHVKRGYDTGTTIFSPQGRILQAEYAREAVMRSFPSLGIQCKDGIVLCGLRRRIHKTLQLPPPDAEPESSTFRDKVWIADTAIAVAAAGLSSDAAAMVRLLQDGAASHAQECEESVRVKWAVESVANVMQDHTQRGGLRPWGISLLIGGWDASQGLQLYVITPPGDVSHVHAAAVGMNHEAITEKLELHAKRVGTQAEGGLNITLEEGIELAVQLLREQKEGELEVALIRLELENKNKVIPPLVHLLTAQEVDRLWNLIT